MITDDLIVMWKWLFYWPESFYFNSWLESFNSWFVHSSTSLSVRERSCRSAILHSPLSLSSPPILVPFCHDQRSVVVREKTDGTTSDFRLSTLARLAQFPRVLLSANFGLRLAGRAFQNPCAPVRAMPIKFVINVVCSILHKSFCIFTLLS